MTKRVCEKLKLLEGHKPCDRIGGAESARRWRWLVGLFMTTQHLHQFGSGRRPANRDNHGDCGNRALGAMGAALWFLGLGVSAQCLGACLENGPRGSPPSQFGAMASCFCLWAGERSLRHYRRLGVQLGAWLWGGSGADSGARARVGWVASRCELPSCLWSGWSAVVRLARCGPLFTVWAMVADVEIRICLNRRWRNEARLLHPYGVPPPTHFMAMASLFCVQGRGGH